MCYNRGDRRYGNILFGVLTEGLMKGKKNSIDNNEHPPEQLLDGNLIK